jgi:hypothetical protein
VCHTVLRSNAPGNITVYCSTFYSSFSWKSHINVSEKNKVEGNKESLQPEVVCYLGLSLEYLTEFGGHGHKNLENKHYLILPIYVVCLKSLVNGNRKQTKQKIQTN